MKQIKQIIFFGKWESDFNGVAQFSSKIKIFFNRIDITERMLVTYTIKIQFYAKSVVFYNDSGRQLLIIYETVIFCI